MSDIHQTIDRYDTVCKASGIEPLKKWMAIFNKEKDDCIFEERSSMRMYLAGNNKLIAERRLDDLDMLILFKTLQNNLYVSSIDLRYNNITDEGAKTVATLIEETAVLRDVNLMCNDFGEEGARFLAKSLHKNETLISLRLNGNKIGNKGGMYFAQALQINVTLEALDLGDTDLKTESVIAFATVLFHNNTLKSLNLNRPILFSNQEETTVHFAKMLKVNRSLKELHLQKYDMRDFGVTRLAENLMDNMSLTHLDLSCNRMTRDGAMELAKLLKKDTALQVLDLGFNRLGDDGAMHLAEALATMNTNLHTLVLTSNEMNGKGLCAIADCLKLNTTLSNVYIWGNNLEESACIAFSSLLSTGRLGAKATDVQPYEVDGVTYLSEQSHGIRRWYYWGPSYGDQAQPDLAAFTDQPQLKV